jgi:predicted transcriptional regulator
MTKDVLLSVRIPSALNAKLERLAKSSRRSKSAAVTAILTDHVDDEAAYVAAVEEGLADARGGGLIDHEQVVARIERKMKARMRRRGKVA